jgi:hypothetical protein
MRRIYTRLIGTLTVAAAALLLGGCSSSSTDDNVKTKDGTGVPLNPGGKPTTADDTDRAAKMQQTGNAMNADQMKAAAAIRDAKARSGGK